MQRQRRPIPLLITVLTLGFLLNAVSSEKTPAAIHQSQQGRHQEGHHGPDHDSQHRHHHKHGNDSCDSHSHEHAQQKRKRNAEDDDGEEEEEARGKSIRRHPVHIYKGAEPWRPLSNSAPFGVSPVELPPAAPIDEEEEEEQSMAQREAQQLALDGGAPSNNGVPIKVPGALNGVAAIDTISAAASDQLPESVTIDHNEGVKWRTKNALHESLRRPLRRLTDRQLALLLKQIRKQRREQFGQNQHGNEQSPISSRQEMIDQLQSLLKQPQDGQRLIRPKLLTNVNILPNEWAIYPAPRNIGPKKGNESEGQRAQQKAEEEQKQLSAVHTIAVGDHPRTDLSEGQPQNGVRALSSTSSSSTATQPPSASVDPAPMQPQFELKATIRPPIVQSVVLVSEPEQTTATITIEQPQKLETDQHQQQQEENSQKSKDDEKNNGTTTAAAKLEASWQLEEQKLMAEMRTAVQKADSAMEKLESKRKEPTAQAEERPPAAQNFAPKIADRNDDKNDQSEFKVFNVSHFAEQERNELGELSTALREIRLRYETVKHEFQSKMKRMGLAHRFKTPAQFKAAGITTFIEEEAQNGTAITEGRPNLDDNNIKTASNANGPSSETGNGTIGNATDGTTADQKQNVQKKTLAAHEEEEPTTAVPIPKVQRDRKPSNGQKSAGKNETAPEEEEGTLNVGKAKPKLTLAELAEELEQIERTIATRKGKAGLKELETESGTLQKAKKILQKGKKAKEKNRSRVSSTSPHNHSKGNSGGTSQSINKIVAKIKLAAAQKEEQQQKKVEKQQQQQQKSHGNASEIAVKTDTHQQQAVQPTGQHPQQPSLAIPFVKMTPKSRIALSQSTTELGKLKTVLVDTSTEQDGGGAHSADAQHQQPNQHVYHDQQPKNNQFNQPRNQQQQFHPLTLAADQHNSQQQLHPFQQTNVVQQRQQFHQQSQNAHQQQHRPGQQQQFVDHHQQLQKVQHPLQQLGQPPAGHAQGKGTTNAAAGGGFYQLERAQVANVSQQQKTPKPSPSELRLKGVAQLEVGKGIDNEQRGPTELSNSQLSSRLRKEWLRKNGTKLPKEDDDLANLEEFARIDEQAICDAIACNFETGTLCEWEASVDELNPGDPRYRRYMMARTVLLMRHRRRSKRNVDEVVREEEEEEKQQGDDETATEFGQNLSGSTAEEADTTKANRAQPEKADRPTDRQQQPPLGGRTVLRSWHNWVGRYRNRLTGIAQSEVFSTRNQRFAASYLKPGQRSTLTGRLLSGDRATIRFKAWEATRSLQLRMCCDRTDRDENCVFSTELGAKRSSRKWTDHLATCPQGTKKIIFECRNQGPFQGACGVDNIQLVNAYCPSVTPMKANRKVLKK